MQLAPYLETILQVISPHFLFSQLQPRPTVRCAVLDQANELESLRTQVAGMSKEIEATGGSKDKAAAREKEREALRKKVRNKVGRGGLRTARGCDRTGEPRDSLEGFHTGRKGWAWCLMVVYRPVSP